MIWPWCGMRWCKTHDTWYFKLTLDCQKEVSRWHHIWEFPIPALFWMKTTVCLISRFVLVTWQTEDEHWNENLQSVWLWINFFPQLSLKKLTSLAGWLSSLTEQAGSSNNKWTVNCIFVQNSRPNYTLYCNIEKNTLLYFDVNVQYHVCWFASLLSLPTEIWNFSQITALQYL